MLNHLIEQTVQFIRLFPVGRNLVCWLIQQAVLAARTELNTWSHGSVGGSLIYSDRVTGLSPVRSLQSPRSVMIEDLFFHSLFPRKVVIPWSSSSSATSQVRMLVSGLIQSCDYLDFLPHHQQTRKQETLSTVFAKGRWRNYNTWTQKTGIFQCYLQTTS